MPKAPRGAPSAPIARVFDDEEASLLDVLDHVLSKGVMASGDVTLGVAGVDLIYVRLSALLCGADRVLPRAPRAGRRRRTRGSRSKKRA